MGLILRFIFSAITGFACHIFWKPSLLFGQKYGVRWGAKIRHAIGILTIATPIALVRESIEMPEGKTKTFVSVLLAGLFYGGGNFLAHLLDKDNL